MCIFKCILGATLKDHLLNRSVCAIIEGGDPQQLVRLQNSVNYIHPAVVLLRLSSCVSLRAGGAEDRSEEIVIDWHAVIIYFQ